MRQRASKFVSSAWSESGPVRDSQRPIALRAACTNAQLEAAANKSETRAARSSRWRLRVPIGHLEVATTAEGASRARSGPLFSPDPILVRVCRAISSFAPLASRIVYVSRKHRILFAGPERFPSTRASLLEGPPARREAQPDGNHDARFIADLRRRAPLARVPVLAVNYL